MALTYNVNTTPATGAVAMYTLIGLLVGSANWTKPKDSDGTTYSSSGVQVTGGGVGTNGLGNNSAWVNVKMSGSNKSLTIQRGTTDLLWRIVYSPSVGFTSGAPGATQVPTASDGIIILGSGTDAAPGFATLYPANGSYRLECAADSAAPFGFWSIGFPTGSSTTNNCSHEFFMDAMRTGTNLASDTDPYVFGTSSGGGSFGSSFTTGLKCTSPINSTTLVGPIIVAQPATPLSGYIADPVTGKHVLRLVEYVVASSMYKGVSTYFLADTFQGDITPTPLTLVTSLDKMVIGYMAVDWNGSAIVI